MRARLGRKALATLCPAPRQNFTTVGRFHSRSEAMTPLAYHDAGLKSSFHGCTPRVLGPCPPKQGPVYTGSETRCQRPDAGILGGFLRFAVVRSSGIVTLRSADLV